MYYPFVRRWLGAAIIAALLAGLAITNALAAPAAQEEVTPSEERGVLVLSVAADSPASEAGIQRGDIILAVDGEEVNLDAELLAVIHAHKAGDEVGLIVQHGDDVVDRTITLGERNGQAFLGVRLETAPVGYADVVVRAPAVFSQTQTFSFDQIQGGGVVVVEVAEESPAAVAGIQPGDVIVAFDGEPLAPAADEAAPEEMVEPGERLVSLMASHAPGDSVTVTVRRADGDESDLEVELGAHPDDADKAYLGIRYGSALVFPAGPEHKLPMVPPVPAPGMGHHFGMPGVPCGNLPGQVWVQRAPVEDQEPGTVIVEQIAPAEGQEPGAVVVEKIVPAGTVSHGVTCFFSVVPTEAGDTATLKIEPAGAGAVFWSHGPAEMAGDVIQMQVAPVGESVEFDPDAEAPWL